MLRSRSCMPWWMLFSVFEMIFCAQYLLVTLFNIFRGNAMTKILSRKLMKMQVLVIVLFCLVPPEIEPDSVPADVRLLKGSTFRLACRARGSPPPEVSIWQDQERLLKGSTFQLACRVGWSDFKTEHSPINMQGRIKPLGIPLEYINEPTLRC